MQPKPERSEAANDLLTVTVSFVLYMTMLLVLVTVQGQQESGEALPAASGWAMQRILALLLLILGAGHFIGARVVHRQRRLRLLLTAAEVLSAASLFLIAPNTWVWLALAAVAFGAWAFCFQTAVLEFMEQPGEEPEETWPPPSETNTPEPLFPPGEESQEEKDGDT